ncbi:hypothetical protein IFM89_029209 [Coptis chinensis]|uniref:Uncharacterized protein n=1 Tax=Coptis chinensis TaxID=261450 RepID=A0A835IRC7_9MAGN|nr:hypothetical protein IFM89_029209 [Coptis chinensis]
MNECSILEYSKTRNVPSGTRHLSAKVNRSQSSSILQSLLVSLPFLRTLILFYQRTQWNDDLCFISLRAINLNSLKIKTLPDTIGILLHLRYLNLSFTQVTSLPESICNLRNLQTLKLAWCTQLQTLPKNKRNTSLRHLDIRECNKLSQMVIGIGISRAFMAIFNLPGQDLHLGPDVGKANIADNVGFQVFCFLNATSLFISLVVVVVRITLVARDTSAREQLLQE